jgi:hypothetical protein
LCLEDFNSDFLIQLNAWEAARRLFSATQEKPIEAIDVARLLGWTRIQGGKYHILNDTASACHAAYALIIGGHMSRDDLIDMSVKAVAAATDLTDITLIGTCSGHVRD